MTTRIQFLGISAYRITADDGRVVIIDPFLDDNPASVLRVSDLSRVDLLLVTHAAFDHLGDTEAIARMTGAPVLCGGEVREYLMAKGVPGAQIRAVVWGLEVHVAGFTIRSVESHHWSQLTMPNGSFLSGLPMGFVLYAEPGVRIYHHGDTAIFSDLKLIGELYKPNVGLIGVTNSPEVVAQFDGPGRLTTAEMDPREAALAAQWLGLDVVLPCHYSHPDSEDMRAFLHHLREASALGTSVPRAVVLRPGDTFEYEARESQFQTR
jgi:L-ascorbate metabolism protein UlaG (beta-lactamase superfamily)